MVWLCEMPRPGGTLNCHQAINQTFPGASYTKIYRVGVSEESIWWDIISISNSMTRESTVLIHSAISKILADNIKHDQRLKLENSPFPGTLSDLLQNSHKPAF